MNKLLIAATLSLGLSGLAFAQTAMAPSPQEKGLSAPVIALTGVLAKNADALGLDDAQKAALADWLATAPAKRGALEDETVALRKELHDAIVAGAATEDRQAIADRIGANETALVMMRSNCVDNWREVLNAEQFGKLLEMASAK